MTDAGPGAINKKVSTNISVRKMMVSDNASVLEKAAAQITQTEVDAAQKVAKFAAAPASSRRAPVSNATATIDTADDFFVVGA